MVSNTLTGVNKRDVAGFTTICVLFFTHALFRKRPTHHILRDGVCFSHANLVMYELRVMRFDAPGWIRSKLEILEIMS